jgi:hypothetical protein
MNASGEAFFGAQEHCQEGSKAISNEVALHWLMKQFRMLERR